MPSRCFIPIENVRYGSRPRRPARPVRALTGCSALDPTCRRQPSQVVVPDKSRVERRRVDDRTDSREIAAGSSSGRPSTVPSHHSDAAAPR